MTFQPGEANIHLRYHWLLLLDKEFNVQIQLWNEPFTHPYWICDMLATEWIQIVWPM